MPNSQLISLPFAPALAAGEMSRVAEDLEAVGGGVSDYQPPEERPLRAAAEVRDALMTRMGRHFDLFTGLRRDEVGQAERVLEGARRRMHAYWPTGSVLIRARTTTRTRSSPSSGRPEASRVAA
jgi:hypothetical protein